MKIEIKNRFSSEVILTGEYESVAECLSKNRWANLRGADLRGADLRGANLGGANIGGANLRGANIGGANIRGADLRGADLRGANLSDAYLGGANLRDANIRGAYLGGANIGGVAGYYNSHDLFMEAVSRQKVSALTDREWAVIGQITIHRLCWDSIKKRFAGEVGPIFEVLAEDGFGEWLKYWETIKK